jgi:radical SAM superfamily enzyme YgiQ (UPF0313 family)
MLLINSSSRSAVRIFQSFYPIHPPVGIGYLLNAARKAGIKAEHIDEQIDNVVDLLPERLEHMEPPYLFGFSVLTSAMGNAIKGAREIKALYPESTIVFGGPHPTLATEEILSYSEVDLVIRGDGEGPLIELKHCIEEGRDYTHIANLSYRKGSEVVHNPASYFVKDIDTYSPFPHELFDAKKYDMGFLLSSRGCPHRCIFCSINAMPGGRHYRFRSPESIVDELELLYHKYNVTSIIMLDDNFLVHKKRVYQLIEHMQNRNLSDKFTFTFQARGDSADRQLYETMFRAGFKNVLFGLETASEHIMLTIKKGETVAECAEAVKIAKEVGMHTGGTFIFGLPGETHEERMGCVRLAKQLKLDIVRFNNAIPYPGTELYKTAASENLLNVQGMYDNFSAVAGITESPFRKVSFAYIPKGTSEDEIRRDILLAHFSIYLNPAKMFSSVFRSGHSAKWINLGDSLLEFLRNIPALIYLACLLMMKFGQLFYYAVFRKQTKLRLGHFLRCLFGTPPAQSS